MRGSFSFAPLLYFTIRALPTLAGDDSDIFSRSLPAVWHHETDHPVASLFRRDSLPNFPTVGSPEWAQGFPSNPIDQSMTPKAWLDALHAAEAAGKIPNIPVATANADGVPTYGNLDGSQMPVCSAAYKCRSPGQIWDAPDGKIAISFDDGPVPGSSDDLYTFLQKNSIPSTHFLIGINILNNWKEFNTVFNMKRDIAVHTWTHAHMPTLTSEQVIAELGWTMQIIFNSTGGLLPRFWRPPLGYTDTRVDAIAKEVFGLQTIMWNHDTFDWSLTTTMGITNATYIQSEFQGWLTGSKSPGLIVLEHELSAQSVGAFVSAYPLMKQNGWDIVSAAAIGQAGGAYGSTTATDILGNMDPALKAAATGNGTSGKPALSAVSNSTVKSVGVESTNGTTNGTTTSDATRPAAAGFALVSLLFAFVSSV